MEKKRKIYCTVINDLSYDQRMQRIASSLTKSGYEVCLVGRVLPNSKPLAAQIFEQKRMRCFFQKGKFFYLEYNLRLFFFFLFLKNYDAICSIDLDTLLAGRWAAALRRKVCIYDAHEYFTQVPEVVERPKTQKIWEWVARTCIPKVAYHYTVCQSLATVFEKEYGKAFEVIRNMPFAQSPLVEASLPNQDEPYILLYQGMLNDGRGLEELMEAMQAFTKSEVQLWIVGEGDLSEELRNLAKTYKVEDRVHFLGFVAPPELKELTKKVHIGLNLLRNKGLNYYYSLANKFFDYVQAEKPSINMAFPEYVLHNAEFEVALLLETLTPNEIENSIRKLLNEKGLYAQLVNNCKIAKKVWTWENEEKKLINLYEKIWK